MRLDWRRDIVYATMMGVEGCALYVLLALLNQQSAGGRLSIPQLLISYFLAFAFNKVLPKLRWPRFITYPINIVAWIMVTLLMVKAQLFSESSFSDPAWLQAIPQALGNILYAFAPALLLLVCSAFAWWLGWHLARIRAGFSAALGEFQFGLATMLIIFFIASALGVQLDDSIPVTLAFFIFALLGMSIAHAGEGKGWLSGSPGQWPGLLLVSIGLVLVLGLAISLLVTPDLLQLILLGLKWVGGQVMRLIAFLMSLLPNPGPVEPIPGLNMTGGEPKEGGFQFGIPEPLLSALRLSWNILFIGLILIALWRISSQVFGWLRRRLASSDGEVESMPGAFKADILDFLRRILFKLLRLKLPTRRQKKSEPPEIASVRQIYRQLLRWATASGWRRPAFQTPYEYLHTLEKLLPACASDLRLITQHYVSARYGQFSPSAEELLGLKQSWHQINHYRLAHHDAGVQKSI